MGDAGKRVVIVGIDDSSHSYHALESGLDLFFVPLKSKPSPFKLIILHARPSPSALLGFKAPGSIDVLPITMVDEDYKKAGQVVIQKAKDICSSKKVEGAQLEVMEGDPRDVMMKAVEKFQASVLILGSHGYGAVKRAVLGSVSDYCAHHAHCSVMIVKNPEANQSPN